MGVGEACRHQGTHKDKDVDMGGPLRQGWPAYGGKGEAPRNRNISHRSEGMGSEYGKS